MTFNHFKGQKTNSEHEDGYPPSHRKSSSLGAASCQAYNNQSRLLPRSVSECLDQDQNQDQNQDQLMKWNQNQDMMLNGQPSSVFSMTSMTSMTSMPGSASSLLRQLANHESFGSMAISTVSLNTDELEPVPAGANMNVAINADMDIDQQEQYDQQHPEPISTRANLPKMTSKDWISQGKIMSIASLSSDLSFREFFTGSERQQYSQQNSEGSISRSAINAYPDFDHLRASLDSSDLQPTERDILSGRGSITNNHAGNIAYRDYVKRHLATYQSLDKTGKKEFTEMVRDDIQNSGGRFLKFKKSLVLGKGCWVLMDHNAARKKVGQNFRDCKSTSSTDNRRSLTESDRTQGTRNIQFL